MDDYERPFVFPSIFCSLQSFSIPNKDDFSSGLKRENVLKQTSHSALSGKEEMWLKGQSG